VLYHPVSVVLSDQGLLVPEVASELKS